MKRSMEQVKKAALDNAPTRLLAKTTGFFDNMCCASYMREQVAGEAIELDYEGDDNSIMQPAFMWMDIDEVGGEEEYKSKGEWSDDEDEDWQSDCEVFSRSPARRSKIIESNSSPTTPLTYYPDKIPHRSPSTATTEFSYNTSDSWETAATRHSLLSSPNPAASGDESVFSKSRSDIIYVSRNDVSSAPRTISIPTFKLKKRQSQSYEDFPDLPGSSMSIPEMRSDSRLGRMSYVGEAEAFRC
jgi:hypothetical protein